jgi:hypothetical protein
VSGPSSPARRGQAARQARRAQGLAALGQALLGHLERRRALDRLLRGRAAIALVAFALIGIVTLQLALLELNAGIGRTLQRQASLQRGDAQLSIENSELAATERVQSRATAAGMSAAPTRALRFLHSGGPADAARGAAALKPPSPEAHASWGEASGSGSGAGETTGTGEASETQKASGGSASEPSSSSGESEAKAGGSGGTESAAKAETTSKEEGSGEAAASSPAQAGGATAAPGG